MRSLLNMSTPRLIVLGLVTGTITTGTFAGVMGWFDGIIGFFKNIPHHIDGLISWISQVIDSNWHMLLPVFGAAIVGVIIFFIITDP